VKESQMVVSASLIADRQPTIPLQPRSGPTGIGPAFPTFRCLGVILRWHRAPRFSVQTRSPSTPFGQRWTSPPSRLGPWRGKKRLD